MPKRMYVGTMELGVLIHFTLKIVGMYICGKYKGMLDVEHTMVCLSGGRHIWIIKPLQHVVIQGDNCDE